VLDFVLGRRSLTSIGSLQHTMEHRRVHRVYESNKTHEVASFA
ncbi:hypothetical protein SOVF_215510, partial [Spinacia oleracea]